MVFVGKLLVFFQVAKKRLLTNTDPKQPLELVKSFTVHYYDNNSFSSHTANYTSFILVRHPFNRLVSAYRDKLERASSSTRYQLDYYYRVYGQEAVRKYRKKAEAIFGIEFFSALNNFGSPLPNPKKGTMGSRTKQHPIFWEFVQLLKSRSPAGYDNHWQPMHLWCNYCNMNYASIFYFEKLSQESPFIKEMLNPGKSNQHAKVGWLNPTTGQDMDRDRVVEIYFKQLSDEDILALYKIYEVDFLSFGYTYQRGNLTLPLT